MLLVLGMQGLKASVCSGPVYQMLWAATKGPVHVNGVPVENSVSLCTHHINKLAVALLSGHHEQKCLSKLYRRLCLFLAEGAHRVSNQGAQALGVHLNYRETLR